MDETQTAPAFQTNKPLANIVIDEVQRQTSDDAVRDLVAANVEKLIKQTVESALRSYGDLGKRIEKQVEAALDIGDLTIPSYSHMVTAVVRAKVDEHMDTMITGRLKVELDEILLALTESKPLRNSEKKDVSHG